VYHTTPPQPCCANRLRRSLSTKGGSPTRKVVERPVHEVQHHVAFNAATRMWRSCGAHQQLNTVHTHPSQDLAAFPAYFCTSQLYSAERAAKVSHMTDTTSARAQVHSRHRGAASAHGSAPLCENVTVSHNCRVSSLICRLSLLWTVASYQLNAV
jgi:hypothetical protein